jgi:hypothetical protein
VPVPRSVEDLVAARVAALSLDARIVTLAAAALSQPTVDTVVDAFDGEGDARALIEAEDAGVLPGLFADRGCSRNPAPERTNRATSPAQPANE